MARNSRIAGLCLAALAAVLVTAAPSAADNSKYFPPDVEIIVNVNLKQVMDSELIKSNKEMLDNYKAIAENALKQNEEAEKLFKELGFDPLRDLDGVTSAIPPSTDATKGIVIVNGTVDAKKFAKVSAQVAEAHGDVVKLTKVGKHQIVEITPPGEDKTYCLCLAEPNVLLLTQGKAAMTAALERAGAAGAGKGAGLKKEVRDLLATSDPKASLSFVATGAALAKLATDQNVPNAEMVAPLLQGIAGFNGNVTVKKDVEFQLGIGTESADKAKELAQQAAFGLFAAKAMVAKQAKDNEKLAPLVPVVNTLRATARGNTLIIQGQVSAEVLAKALKNIPPPQQ
jgi:hypothetical protein